MNLKGYQWLNKDGKVLMTYVSKFNKILVWEDITEKDEIDFHNYLKQKGIECNHTDYQWHTNLDLMKESE